MLDHEIRPSPRYSRDFREDGIILSAHMSVLSENGRCSPLLSPGSTLKVFLVTHISWLLKPEVAVH